jgi:hypothetical protein
MATSVELSIDELSIDQEILLLQFWALSVEIARRLPAELRDAIGGLEASLDAAAAIPAAIGWEDDVTMAAALPQGAETPRSRRRQA